MANKFFCEYCGKDFNSVRDLVAQPCINHPNGSAKGNHKLYEGSIKSKYTCKYCGKTYNSIRELTAQPCINHPNGSAKGKHSPAL